MISRTTNYQSIRRDDDRNNHDGIAATTTQSNHHVSSSSNVQMRPMGYLTNIERRKRFRFIILMALLCIAIAITFLLWFWFLHVQPRLMDPYVNHDSTYKSRSHDEMQQISDTALFNLNRNYVNGITGSTSSSTGTKSSSDHIPDHCETTLLVFRHCDKLETNDDDDENGNTNGSTSKKENINRHCSDVGYERAQYITTLFGNSNTSRWPTPNYLYALSSHRDSYENYREFETLLPLSHLISVPIQNVTSTPVDTLAREYFFPLLTAGTICGQISVVSWKHHWIPKLVNSLGCGPDNGCPMFYPTDTFDQVWELKFIFRRATRRRRRMTTPTINDGSSSSSSSSSRTDDDSLPSSDTVIVEPSVSSFHVWQKKTKKHHHHHRRYHHHDDDTRPSSFSLDDEHQTNNMTTRDHWIVIGTVTYQMFDPLQYSKLHGHYPTTP